MTGSLWHLVKRAVLIWRLARALKKARERA
jgi:hypothetical protein